MQHLLAIGGEYTLRVELNAAYVECLMLQGHNLSLVALGRDFKAIGEVFLRNHPRMVAAYGKFLRDTREKGIVACKMAGRSHTVEDVAQVLKLTTKGLADSLMTEANAQNGLLAGICANDIEQQTSLRGDARTRGKDN